MPSRRIRVRSVARALCLVASVAAVAPAIGSAASTSSVTLVGEPGDVGDGGPLVLSPENADIDLRGTTRGFSLAVDSDVGHFYFNVAPRTGERLRNGLFTGARRFADAARPALDVSGGGRGCNATAGSFNIKSFTTGASGAITSLWMTFEQRCGGVWAAPLVGEIRYRRPRPAGALFATPATITFAEVSPGGRDRAVPITYVNQSDGAVDVPRVSLIGSEAGDYAIDANSCAGATLAPGDSCAVEVGFAPKLAGPRLARVVATDSLGRRYVTTLDGRGAPGRTRLVLDGDPGEPFTGGNPRTLTEADGGFSVAGSPAFIQTIIRPPDWWTGWRVELDPPEGAALAAGSHFTGAKRYPANGEAPGLDVIGDGDGCNDVDGEFTVDSIAFDAAGDVRQFGASFVHRCDGRTAALRGTLEYRVPFGDSTPPARVGSLAATREGSAVSLSWTSPPGADFARTIVRVARGATAPNSPVSGLPVVSTRGTSARTTFGAAASFAVFSVDTAGNVSSARTVRVPAAG